MCAKCYCHRSRPSAMEQSAHFAVGILYTLNMQTCKLKWENDLLSFRYWTWKADTLNTIIITFTLLFYLCRMLWLWCSIYQSTLYKFSTWSINRSFSHFSLWSLHVQRLYKIHYSKIADCFIADGLIGDFLWELFCAQIESAKRS